MLGETYELVTEDFRFFSEQVSHHPPISAYHQQGKGYWAIGFSDTKSTFGFGGGKGLMEIYQKGYQDYYYENYGDMISVGRPKIYACNLVMGTLYIDYEGTVDCINHMTKERAECKFECRGWSSNSKVTVKLFNRLGENTHNITGSWWDKLVFTELATGKSEVLFEELPPIPNHNRQFGFSMLALNLNYTNSELEKFLAPTDTRFRNDQRLFEHGKTDEADEEKIRLEVK